MTDYTLTDQKKIYTLYHGISSDMSNNFTLYIPLNGSFWGTQYREIYSLAKYKIRRITALVSDMLASSGTMVINLYANDSTGEWNSTTHLTLHLLTGIFTITGNEQLQESAHPLDGRAVNIKSDNNYDDQSTVEVFVEVEQ